MKKVLFLSACLIFLFNSCNCDYRWLWAKGISSGDGANKLINNITTDQNDNVIVIGSFMNSGNADILLKKYGPLGNLLWTQTIGGGGAEQGDGIATDQSGNIYVSGAFNSPTLFSGANEIKSIGGFDFFTAKYDPNGNLLWARSAGGGENDGDNETRLAIDNNRNVYISSRYMGGALKFTAPNANITVTNKRASGLFLVKYDTDGNLIWAKSTSGILNDAIGDIAVDGNGGLYQTGFYMSNLYFDASHTLSSGSFHIFFAKYSTADGSVLIAEDLGVGRGFGLVCDESNDVYLTGISLGNLAFPPLVSPALKDHSYTLWTGDFFIAKYKSSGGTWEWLRSAGGNYQDFGKGLAYKNGLIWVIGAFDSQTLYDFGSGVTLQNATSTITDDNSANQFDVFLATYNKSGHLTTATKVGNNDTDYGTRIAIDNQGDACVTGCFNSEKLVFGNHIVPKEDNRLNLFVAKCSLSCKK